MSNQSYASQNLQNRAFVEQDLTEVNFSGADLRGCDFTRATLIGANFDRAITGQSQRQINTSILSVIIGAVVIVAFSFILVKIDSLLIGFFGDTYKKIGGVLSITLPFLLILFRSFIFNKFSPQIIIFFGNASLGILLAVMIFLTVGLVLISFSGGTGSLLFLLPMLVSAIVTVRILKWLIESIKSETGTSFRKANLTNANFSNALIKNTDFSFALLTGVCIDGWLLDLHNLFAKSQCEYLYLKSTQQNRYPITDNFQADELEKFLKQSPINDH